MTLFDFIIRIAISVLCGSFIGVERQLTGHPAGIRTNILVCMGSTMFVLFSMVMDAPDQTRVAAQIVTGVGFICSGIIFKDGMNVRGLNTAATIWCTAAIGVLTSSGKISYAMAATVLLIATNTVFRLISNKINPLMNFDDTEIYYIVTAACLKSEEMMIRSAIMNYITGSKLVLAELESSDADREKVCITAKLVCYGKRRDDITEKLVSALGTEQNVTSAGWEVLS